MISIIIPTYGEPTYLSKAIESVYNQTYKDWELIIVDDNDPHSEARKATESLINSLELSVDKLLYIKHPKNLNGATARNTGIAVAKGEFISFLDSDDEYLPDRLEKCLGAIKEVGKEYAGVFTGCEFRRQGNTYLKYCDVKTGNHLVPTLAGNFMFCTGSNLFVRREVVEELKGFDVSFLRHQDYEFLVRLFEKYSLVAIPELLVIKNNENLNLPAIDKLISIKEQYLDKYRYVIASLDVKQRNYIFHTNCVSIAELALLQHATSIAKDYYSRASQYSRLSLREFVKKHVLMVKNLLNR